MDPDIHLLNKSNAEPHNYFLVDLKRSAYQKTFKEKVAQLNKGYSSPVFTDLYKICFRENYKIRFGYSMSRVTKVQRVLRLRMEETASRYGG
jgi:hypothetical protein